LRLRVAMGRRSIVSTAGSFIVGFESVAGLESRNQVTTRGRGVHY